MSTNPLFDHYIKIRDAAAQSDDGGRCMVAPHPDLHDKIKKEIETLRANNSSLVRNFVRATEPNRHGFNDGMIIPPDEFSLGTPLSRIRSAAAERAPLHGTVRVIVVLVDFSDKPMAKTQQHFKDLFFSEGVIATKSVREYYKEVTNGLVELTGEVVGPFRMPKTLAQYANGASGIGGTAPNSQTMARDAASAANASVNFTPYDNDGNGFVDAFIVIHAGSGAEVTGASGDIWSHKWVVSGGAMNVDSTKIYAYLTVPEDCRIGVCAHELGHLLFGFPDLYDTDYSSEGIGNWCLMAGGSWGGGGDTPSHPSAWCKANQGWVTVVNRTTNGTVNVADVKDSRKVYRLWKNGAASSEYFLVENRQKKQFDTSLPAGGLLIWHIDESVGSNTNEAHYKVALMQADGLRNLENGANRGDGGDPFPGSTSNVTFNNTSTPNSKSYSNAGTCVAVTSIPASAPTMTVKMQVSCKAKPKKELIKDKEFAKEGKEIKKEFVYEKNVFVDKKIEKPQTDKAIAYDKLPIEKFSDGKFTEGKFTEGKPGEGWGSQHAGALEERVASLESAIRVLLGGHTATPFIDSELRPDLTRGAFANEPDLMDSESTGDPGEKRLLDKNHEL